MISKWWKKVVHWFRRNFLNQERIRVITDIEFESMDDSGPSFRVKESHCEWRNESNISKMEE